MQPSHYAMPVLLDAVWLSGFQPCEQIRRLGLYIIGIGEVLYGARVQSNPQFSRGSEVPDVLISVRRVPYLLVGIQEDG